jgi:hypothetical protein
MNAAINAALLQQYIWEQESLFYKYMLRQLDSFGRSEFVFGQDFLF